MAKGLVIYRLKAPQKRIWIATGLNFTPLTKQKRGSVSCPAFSRGGDGGSRTRVRENFYLRFLHALGDSSFIRANKLESPSKFIVLMSVSAELLGKKTTLSEIRVLKRPRNSSELQEFCHRGLGSQCQIGFVVISSYFCKDFYKTSLILTCLHKLHFHVETKHPHCLVITPNIIPQYHFLWKSS